MAGSARSLIAIVDDDVSFREALASLIKAFGYRVTAFGSAGDFLRSDVTRDVACLVLDVQMPDLGGLELQDRLIAEGRGLPTIFVTASPDPASRLRALEAGALAYLEKPCDQDVLLSHIRSVLDPA